MGEVIGEGIGEVAGDPAHLPTQPTNQPTNRAVRDNPVPVHIVVVQLPVPASNVGVPAKPVLHTQVPGPPVASPVQVDCLSGCGRVGVAGRGWVSGGEGGC